MQPTHKRDDNWSRLLTRVGKYRDTAAFELLFTHYAPLIKGFCLSSPGLSMESAEELLQEVMFQIWRKSPYYEAHRISASTWIFTVMRNCRIDVNQRCRRQMKSSPVDVDDIWDDITESQPFVFLQRSRNSNDVYQSLQNLPVEQFHVVKKVYTEGRSHGEVSVDLDLPLSTVRSRLRLALKKLQVSAR